MPLEKKKLSMEIRTMSVERLFHHVIRSRFCYDFQLCTTYRTYLFLKIKKLQRHEYQSELPGVVLLPSTVSPLMCLYSQPYCHCR